jgi:hypothetical protein
MDQHNKVGAKAVTAAWRWSPGRAAPRLSRPSVTVDRTAATS